MQVLTYGLEVFLSRQAGGICPFESCWELFSTCYVEFLRQFILGLIFWCLFGFGHGMSDFMVGQTWFF